MAYRITIFGVLLSAFLLQPLVAGTIVGSKHDLSSSGYYAVDGAAAGVTMQTEICVFCHTPHNANVDLDMVGGNDAIPAPLWNRSLTSAGGFTPYTSNTMNATCAATPSPVSLVCLSCHDEALVGSGDGGVVGRTEMHQLVNPPNLMDGQACQDQASCVNCIGCHPDGGILPETWFQIGPDLSNDHPISMLYATAQNEDRLLDGTPAYATPPDAENGWSDVKLFAGRVECPSCHNAHDPGNDPMNPKPFLRKTLDDSSLCVTCHRQ
ncbi:Cytochrome c family protein [hydrothermal vent metagenome]|uniref:Cytochrome c family protein n=1 Tax=hydrothermal vent metagenome TaxID=652676 RepID=A0A3B1BGL4_9ZZZZ